MLKAGLTDIQYRFLQVYTVTVLLCWTPSKIFGQVAPLFFIAALIFYVRLKPIRQINRLTVFLVIFLLSSLGWSLYSPEYAFSNSLFWIFTSSHFLLLLFDFKPILDSNLLKRLAMVTMAILFFEACWGVSQSLINASRTGTLDRSTGDRVYGTLELSLSGGRKMGNFFVLLIVTQFLFLFGTIGKKISRKEVIRFGVMLLSWVLAANLHSLFFFAFAMAVTLALFVMVNIRHFRRSDDPILKYVVRGIRLLVVISVLVGLTVSVLLPKNIERIPLIVERALEFNELALSPKIRVVYHTIVTLPSEVPMQPVFGLGAGQYCSRAGMVATGRYASGGRIPFLPTHESAILKRYIMDMYDYYMILPFSRGSSSVQPYSSMIAWYGEFGSVGFFLLIGSILYASISMMSTRIPEFPFLGISLSIMIFFLLFMGIQHIYWEYTQGITPGILQFAIGYSYFRRKIEESRLDGERTSYPVETL